MEVEIAYAVTLVHRGDNDRALGRAIDRASAFQLAGSAYAAMAPWLGYMAYDWRIVVTCRDETIGWIGDEWD